MTLSQVFWLSVVCVSCTVGGCALRPLIQEQRSDIQQKVWDEIERCEKEGFQAAQKGVPVQACPYPSVAYSPYQAYGWKQGWIKGFTKK